MIDPVKRVFQEIEKLPKERQMEMAQLIHDELSWETTFQQNQDTLSQLAKEALNEYKKGNVSDKDW